MRNAILLSIALVVGGNSPCLSAPPAPPTAASLAATLRKQSSATIEARFDGDKKTPEAQEAWRYVRSPEAILFERNAVPPGQSVRYSYDFETLEERFLNSQEPANGQRGYRTGSIRSAPSGPASNQCSVDVVRFDPLGPMPGISPLADLIENGKVSSKMEKIEGKKCWRVDVTGSGSVDCKASIWLDPAIGCCPRRVDVKDPGGTKTSYFFRDYKAVKKGIWFPMKCAMRYPVKPGEAAGALTVRGDGPASQQKTAADLAREKTEWREGVWQASEVRADRTFKKDDLLVKFPEGVRAQDDRPGHSQPRPRRARD